MCAIQNVKITIRFIVFWVTLAGVIVICLYGVEESKLLIKELDDVKHIS